MKTFLITTFALALLILVPACTTEVDARSSGHDRGGVSSTTQRESTSISTPVGSASQSTTVRSSNY